MGWSRRSERVRRDTSKFEVDAMCWNVLVGGNHITWGVVKAGEAGWPDGIDIMLDVDGTFLCLVRANAMVSVGRVVRE